MLIEITLYKIVPVSRTSYLTYRVYKQDKMVAHGFTDIESALKAVHVIEGSVKDDFYTEVNGLVLLNSPLKKH